MQLYALNPDGTGLTLLSRGYRKVLPQWSPNAQKLAYEDLNTGNPTGYVAPAKANGAEPNSIGGGWHPAWSRDSRKVAFIGSARNSVAVSTDGGVGVRIGILAVVRRSLHGPPSARLGLRFESNCW